MPKHDPDRPPAYALLLRDALEQAMDWWDAWESRRLARALAEEAANPPDPTDPATKYFRPVPFRRPADGEEALYSLIRFGAAEAWGQPGWPKNKAWVAIRRPLWQRQRSSIDDPELGLVTFWMPDGITSFWHVRVAFAECTSEPRRRGRRPADDAPFLDEMRVMMLAAERAGSRLRRHAAAMQVIEQHAREGRPVPGLSPESTAKRLAGKFRK